MRFGILRGLVLAGWRLLRCNPWSHGGFDPVEDQRLFKAAHAGAERLTMLISANIFQPLIDVFEAVLKFFHNSVGVPWGWSIVLLTIVVRALLIPLTVKQFQSMQRAAAAPAGDEGDPGEVQGRQAAPAAGDDEVLQGEQRQPAGLVSADGGPAAGLHLAVLHAAPEPARRYLPAACRPLTSRRTWRRITSRFARRARPDDAVRAAATAPSFLFIGDLTNKATARRSSS